jgi:glucose-1-phosphate adenylyltransferase
MDYRELLRFHVDHGADNTRTLIDVLFDNAQQNTSHDFGKDIIPRLAASRKVSVYNFTEMGARQGSYWRDVGTVEAYYRVNMELLLNSFFDFYASASWPLCGPDRQFDLEPGPRKEQETSEHFAVDSMVPETVSIGAGSRVIHSVLSPSVHIEGSAEIRNSILLQNVRVGAGARIQRAILDENVRIGDGVEIGYDSKTDRESGFVTDSGIVVVPANTYVKSPRAATARVRIRNVESMFDELEKIHAQVAKNGGRK